MSERGGTSIGENEVGGEESGREDGSCGGRVGARSRGGGSMRRRERGGKKGRRGRGGTRGIQVWGTWGNARGKVMKRHPGKSPVSVCSCSSISWKIYSVIV